MWPKGREEFLAWLREVEKKWQRAWREARAFEAEPDPSRPKFFITVPYPYTNAPLHIGHGRTYTIGDIVARYKRLRGYNVLYPMAFHITGTPIIAISEMIARGDQKTVQRYIGYAKMYVPSEEEARRLVESFKDPLKLAEFFANNVQADFEALGFSIDWRRKFHTGEPIYNSFVTWQYYRLAEKGLITRGDHIVTYCLLHRQPEGEDDIEDADVNPVEIVEYTAVKFKVAGRDEYLLAATLRPETLYGATNVWVRPDARYVRVETDGGILIMSSKAYVKYVHQNPGGPARVLEEVEGSRLVGLRVLSPLGRELLVLPARFVDPDVATGVVYSEPSDAPYDYVALAELKKNPQELSRYGVDPSVVEKIEPVKIIDVPGVPGHFAEEIVKSMGIERQDDPRLEEATALAYKEEFYKGVMVVDDPLVKGKSVREAREAVKRALVERGEALPFYELNRKARCRAGGEIIVAKIVGQWFIDYGHKWLKEAAKKHVESGMLIKPEKYRKAFLDAIDWLEKRPCARKRGLGTKLPFDPDWIIESLSDSTIYMAFYTIVHKLREARLGAERLKPELFDYVFLGRGSAEEVSKSTGVPAELIEEMRREFEYWYPVDLRHTSTPHISNHLSFFILHHVALFPERHWPRAITLNEPVIREGAKMSKSKGNVINLRDIAERYSADLFRLYVAAAASLDTVLDWREKDVATAADSLARFVSLAREAMSLSCGEGGGDLVARWFKSSFYRLVDSAAKAMESFEVRDYAQAAFYGIMSLFEKLKDIRGSLACEAREVLADWLRVLNPIVPHVTEELWSEMGGRGFLSLDRWPSGYEALFDRKAEILVKAVDGVLSDAKSVLEAVGKRPRRVYVIAAAAWKRKVAEMVERGAGMREIIEEARRMGLSGAEKAVADAVRAYKASPNKEALEVSLEEELEAYTSLRGYLERKLGAEVVVLREEEAAERGVPKAARAMPLRPAIYMEFE